MIRFRLYYDKDKETQWLNEMSEQGWALKKFFAGFYSFEKCEKGEYIYQIDLGDQLYSADEEYKALMRDVGAEIVAYWGYWVIMRRRAADGPFELYTDLESKIEHYKKILRMFRTAMVIELIGMLVEVAGGLSGNALCWAYTALLCAFTIVLVNAMSRTNEVIDGLHEQLDGTVVKRRVGHISLLIPLGIALFSLVVIFEKVMPQIMIAVIMYAAVISALAGAYKTVRENIHCDSSK